MNPTYEAYKCFSVSTAWPILRNFVPKDSYKKVCSSSGTNYSNCICTIKILLRILGTHNSLCLHVDTCCTRWTCTMTAPTTPSLCSANSFSTTRWKRRSTCASINLFTNSASRFSPTTSSWLQGMLKHSILASFIGLYVSLKLDALLSR